MGTAITGALTAVPAAGVGRTGPGDTGAGRTGPGDVGGGDELRLPRRDMSCSERDKVGDRLAVTDLSLSVAGGWEDAAVSLRY